MKIYILLLCWLFQQQVFSQPKINSFAPLSGPVGTLVTINGTGFSVVADNNIVFFGAVRTPVITASATALTVNVPAFTSYQPITVTTGGLTAYAKDKFDVTFLCGTFTANTFPVRKDTFDLEILQVAIDVKDLDNDGKPDFIISGVSEISVLKSNTAPGRFSFLPLIHLDNPVHSYFVTTADIDGDGKPDIVATQYLTNGYESSHIDIYKNVSTPAGIVFSPPVIFNTNGGYGLTVADMDGDGMPDIMTTDNGKVDIFSTDNRQGEVAVHRNTTAGGVLSFESGVDYAIGFNPRQVTTGFINGDDKPDMIVTNQGSSSISIFVNTSVPGILSFNSKVDFATTPGSSPEAVFIVDFDGDGKNDIVVSNNNINSVSNISIFKNITKGDVIAFAPRIDLTTGLNWKSYHLAIGDIDGDGKMDIIANNQTNNIISLFRNTSVSGAISFEPGISLASFGEMRRPLYLGDLDGDGRLDILEAYTYWAAQIATFLNVTDKLIINSFLPTDACEGTKITISGSNFTSVTGVSFGGVAATSFNTLSSTTIEAIVGVGASGDVKVTTPCGIATLGTFTFNTATAAASVSIGAAALPVCTGTEITVTAIPVNGGATPVYQWQLNGIVAGTNSATFTSSTLKNGDIIKVAMSSALACVSGSPATASYVVANVLPAAVATIHIAGSQLAICPGTSITFTCTTTNAGTAPSYNWQVNGKDAAANNDSYTTNTLVDGDVVACVLTSNYACVAPAIVTSNSLPVSVAASVVPSILIEASTNNICKGTMATFTATAINGGASPLYQWYVNGTAVGTNNALYTSNTFADGDAVTCRLTNAGSCNAIINTTSNQILMHVNSTIAPSLYITASTNNICPGTLVTFTATASNIVSAASFQWKLNGSNTGIAHTTYQNNSLANGDKVYCEMTTASACAASPYINSDTISMAVKPVAAISFHPSNPSITLGSSIQLNATVTGAFNSYVWAPATGLNNTAILNPIASPLSTTTYQLSVITEDCTAGKSLTVTVIKDIFIPSSFSPNGDGNNDVFRIPPGTYFKLATFIVYDKYGNEIFKAADISKGWDGTYKGEALPAGAYVYMIKGTGIKGLAILKGSILLLR